MSSQDQIMATVRSVPDSQVASDLDATAAWAKSTGKADTDRLGDHGILLGRASGVALRRP